MDVCDYENRREMREKAKFRYEKKGTKAGLCVERKKKKKEIRGIIESLTG